MVPEESNPDVGAERKPFGVSERLVLKRDVVSEFYSTLRWYPACSP